MIKFKKYTEDELNHLKQVQLLILKDVISICEKNNLKYYLYGGTLLGAIRHEGFIPWDDDIDIAMFRQDYEKIISIMNSTLTDKYDILTFDNQKECFFPFTKVSLKETRFEDWWADQVSFNEGIFIDIFPLDNAPESKLKRLIQFYRCNLFDQLLINSIIKFNTESKLKNCVHNMFNKILKIISKYLSLKNNFKKNLTKYNDKETQYVTNYFAQLGNKKFGKTGIFHKKDFEPSQKVKFEFIYANIPCNYDRILTDYYGDYMELPPENERFNHAPEVIDFGEY